MSLSLVGCSPEIGAVSGVSVDASGRPVGLVLTCSRDARLDVAVLQDAGGGQSSSIVGQWVSRTPLTGVGTLDMSNPGPGWSTLISLGALVEGHTYSFSWGTTDNRWDSDGVDFTAADLAGIPVGRVRFIESVSSDGLTPRYEVASAADFRRQACAIRR